VKLLASLRSRFVVWVWNHTPTCAEMSRLTSRSLEQPLTLRMRLKMRLHFVICAWCRRYFEQIHFLHQSAPKLNLPSEESPGRGLPLEAKERIKTEIRKNLKPTM
jgi:hypothetical protein